MSESEVDDETADSTSSGELTMITEVWIEPQHGFVANSTPERLHYDGSTFSQWPERVSSGNENLVGLHLALYRFIKKKGLEQ